MQIIIVGMHRSGTSCVTRLVNMMGAYFSPKRLEMPPQKDNPKGFWERLDVEELNKDILKASNATWSQVSQFNLDNIDKAGAKTFNHRISSIVKGMDEKGVWVLKDPRMCLTLPVWKQYLPRRLNVFVYRNPIQVAQSLLIRHSFPLYVGIALWEYYTVHALKACTGSKTIFISYEAVLSKPVEQAYQLFEQLQQAGVTGLSKPNKKQIEGFVETGLNHASSTSEDFPVFLNLNQLDLLKFIEAGVISDDVKNLMVSENSLEILEQFTCSIDQQKKMELELVAVQRIKDTQQHELNLSREENNKIAEALTNVQRVKDTKQHELNLSREERNKIAMELASAQRVKDTKQHELNLSREERNKIAMELASAQRIKDTKQHELNLSREERNKIAMELANVQRIKDTKQHELNLSREENNKIAMEMAAVKQENEELKQERNLILSSNESIEEVLVDTEDQLNSIALKHNTQLSLIEQLMTKDKENSNEIDFLKAEYDSLKNGLENKLNKQRTAYNNLQNKLKHERQSVNQLNLKLFKEAALGRYRFLSDLKKKLGFLPGMFRILNSVENNLKRKRNNRIIKQLKDSHLFDSEFYLNTYPDVCESNVDPLWHFVTTGVYEGRWPNSHFSPVSYLQNSEDVTRAGINPLVHYFSQGWTEGRNPSDEFDTEFYLSQNPDVRENGENPLGHFLAHGLHEGREPRASYHHEVGCFLREIRPLLDALSDSCFHEEGFRRRVSGFFEIDSSVFSEVNVKDNKLYNSNIDSVWYWPVVKEKHFNESAYLEQNTDVKVAIADGEFVAAEDHWNVIGRTQCEQGKRLYFPGIIRKASGRWGFNKFIKESFQKDIETWSYKPKISILMPVYNVDRKWLALALNSVQEQLYPHWELCLADDASTNTDTVAYLNELTQLNDSRIKIAFLDKNVGISSATNAASKLAEGDYISLMDNDDELAETALFEIARTIVKEKPDIIYSDEDKIDDQNNLIEPHYKPDFAPDLLRSQNYICHFVAIKKTIFKSVGGFKEGFQGAQDFDLLLRCSAKAKTIKHIQSALYHWRKIPGSTAASFDFKNYAWENGRKALSAFLVDNDFETNVVFGKYPGTYRVKYTIKGNPLVSIIIPFKDKPELLDQCIHSILDKTDYSHFEIIGISNNSKDRKTFRLMKQLSKLDQRIKFYEHNIPFNFSSLINFGANRAQGEHLLMLNNDTEVISQEWLSALLEHSQRPEVGAVGGKLLYPDASIQHVGVIIGMDGVAGHSHKHLAKDDDGYFGRPEVVQNMSALTGACLMIKKEWYSRLGGLNEENLSIAFNDIDFCLRVLEEGLLNVYTPYCVMYHHESISRGHEDTIEKQQRFTTEIEYMKKRHKRILQDGDPFYNKNLTLKGEDISLKKYVIT